MICATQRLSLCLCTVLLLLVGKSDAFHLPSSRSSVKLSPPVTVTAPECRGTLRRRPGKVETGTFDTALDVINNKKKKGAVVEPPEKEKVGGIGLFFLYMTPWKNPNSIFVYMLLTLYFLGKYSEAHSVATSSGL